MSNADTNNIGIRLMIAGEFLNTWGDPNLNNDLKVLSNLASGWNPITINGDYTVSETLYATNNATEVATIKLVAGTVSAAFAFIMAGRPKRLLVWNSTTFACTARLSATAGFAIPAGYMALVGTDGTSDVYNISPNIVAGPLTVAGQVHGVAVGTAPTDATNLAQVSAAIADAALPATAGTVRNSINDSAADYLSNKVDAVTAPADLATIVWSTENPGAVEKSLATLSTRRVLRRALFAGQV